jgi:hypothetical protein
MLRGLKGKETFEKLYLIFCACIAKEKDCSGKF